MIKRIKVKNFKSFKDLELELGNFNVLIGANASGKSNFVQIFKFLKDIAIYGLKNAISIQGGVEYIRNIKIGNSENLYIRVDWDVENRNNKNVVEIVKGLFEEMPKDLKSSDEGNDFSNISGLNIYEVSYEFELEFGKRGFKIQRDKLTFKYGFQHIKGKVVISNEDGNIKTNIQGYEGSDVEKLIYALSNYIYNLPKKEKNPLLLETPLLFMLYPQILDISIYNFNPELSKKAIPLTGKTELEEDGSNLPIVLREIIADREKRRSFFNLLSYVLPFVKDVRIEKLSDKFFILKIQEEYFSGKDIPAFLISDGTINLIALIIAIYFENKPVIIIEEPEKNIHPYLIHEVVDMMKDASEGKQIIITTHNPEVVKWSDLDNLLLVSRDKEGFSVISRPRDSERVKKFLENEIGVHELYVQNLI